MAIPGPKVTKKPRKKVVKKKKGDPLKMHSRVGRQELTRLKNIQANQYGAEGDIAYLTKLAKLVGSGKRESGTQDWKVRAGKATRDKQALRAGKTVQAELNPMISAAKNYESGLQNMYAKVAKDQNAVFGNMQGQQQAVRNRIGTSYDDLASSVASEFNKSKESSSDELSRLGINMADTSQAGDIQARLQSLAASGKANALTTQDLGSQGYGQLMGLLQGETAATGAGLRAASSQRRGELESSRAGKVYSLWQTLEDQQRAEKAESKQQNFLNRITRSRLGSENDYRAAQSLGQLAGARKNIVDSKRPTTVTKTRPRPKKYRKKN